MHFKDVMADFDHGGMRLLNVYYDLVNFWTDVMVFRQLKRFFEHSGNF